MARQDITGKNQMKKSLLILGVCLVAFSSCKKDDDKYVPQFMSGKKIERISYKTNSGDKRLSQVWKWKDNGQLGTIDYYANNSVYKTEYFTFNDDNLITKVDDYKGEIIEYKYDGTRLVKGTYYEDGNLTEEYNLKYKDGKLSSMEKTVYNSSKKHSDETHLRVFSNILPDNIVKTLAEEKVMNNSISNDRDARTISYSFTWTGSNITKITMTDNHNQGSSYHAEYEYDNKKSPFCEFYEMDGDDIINNVSANNLTKETRKYENNDETNVETFGYEYDGDYPIECRKYESDGSVNLFYYYEYMD